MISTFFLKFNSQIILVSILTSQMTSAQLSSQEDVLPHDIRAHIHNHRFKNSGAFQTVSEAERFHFFSNNNIIKMFTQEVLLSFLLLRVISKKPN